jgi:site-specific recombinase XerD
VPDQKPETAHTLADLSQGYLAHLEQRGMSLMSRASYENDLKLALRELGEKTKLAALTQKKVQNYFESTAVCQTRAGRAKAAPTIAKARRVLRLSLCWAQEAGWIAEAPIPERYRRKSKKKAE